MKTTLVGLAAILAFARSADAAEYHVSLSGNDANAGTRSAPLRTIRAAAERAQPGDIITVHAGTYRERVAPPRGGESDAKRIIYQAAPGEKVEIKGSEVVTNWVKVQGDVWKVALPNSFFGRFNPYSDLIHGDWFNPRGRQHHTGAVYLNGNWLVEAAKLEEVLAPGGTPPRWLVQGGQDYLLNVAWFRPSKAAENALRTPAAGFAAQEGIQTAPCSEGGECIGWVDDGDWARYDRVDFGRRTDQIEFRAASATTGGIIEVRLNTPQGQLLGACPVPNTGGWQSWSSFNARLKPVSGLQTICLLFKALKPAGSEGPPTDTQLWFAEVGKDSTTIWAQFKGVDPNRQLVEINARQTVFYPEKPGINYITLRGFALRHAATPWAPPTAEQIGLIGTHWSKGWIIEDNIVSHSTCSGIALGKHGDRWDNTSADTAEGYVKTIERAHAFRIPWTRDNIGHHRVRNNTISHCEQAGIVGSLGAAFCTVTGNTIHDIHVRRLFTGAEMAGIKFHAAIDTTIQGNHIYRTCRGLWLDWMAQGTRVSGNLFHDNASEDLFLEVDHGPFLVDNNLFLSRVALLDMSEGGAFAHNLFTGKIICQPEKGRDTPYHPAHSTKVAGLVNIQGGDDRFYNNIFVGDGGSGADAGRADPGHSPRGAGYGLWVYDVREAPLQTGGNAYYHGARAYAREAAPLVCSNVNPAVKLVEQGAHTYLEITLDKQLKRAGTSLVTTTLLGRAKIPNLPYENPDGTPLKVDRDYFGKKRSQTAPSPGPFENPLTRAQKLRVW